MRLIDADVLEKIMTEDWFLHILVSENNMQESIKNCIDSVPLAYDVEKVAELAMYQTIGTVEECRTAVERMKPRKAVPTKDGNLACECGLVVQLGNIRNCLYYCHNCGQALDWSE